MRFVLAAASVLCLSAVYAFAQTSPTVTPGVHQAAWDYSDADFKTYGVTSFELCVDGSCKPVGLPTPFRDGNTSANAQSYAAPLPPLTMGPHTFAVRVCNPAGCTDPAPAFNFTVVTIPAPASNSRIVAR